jgi:glucose-6-phosphate 1-dehydrogenase
MGWGFGILKRAERGTEVVKGMKTAVEECDSVEIEGEVAPPCALVIFGASGDLTKKKLIPALYNLAKYRVLSEHFFVVGMARRALSPDVFRQQLREDLNQFACPVAPERWGWFSERFHYVSGDLNDPGSYRKLKEFLAQLAKDRGGLKNILYYLSVSPHFFAGIVQQLGAAGLTREDPGQSRRVIFEKPFGSDLASAKSLDAEIKTFLGERQIYRIDHYLGKATVQNLMVFRFANGIFEPIWDRRYIDHIQITAAETLGVENRAGYYDAAGALRDMVPNHLFQLLTLTAMECPVSFDADAVRDEQAKVLHAVQSLGSEDVLSKAVRGQYGEGTEGNQRVPAYRTEPGVAPDSRTETFAALRLMIDNWRWAGVPFYLRTGKRLARRVTEITIQFLRPPFRLFRETPVEHLKANQLVINIQPDEGISLSFQAKVPGGLMKLGTVDMSFAYADYFGKARTTGYERLIYDAMCGDATLFQRADMVEAGWKVIAPIQDVWNSSHPRSFPNYAAGTWGPEEASALLKRDGREWRESEG